MMKRSEPKPKSRKYRPVRRCLALFMVLSVIAALALPGYGDVSTENGTSTESVSSTESEEEGLIAWFDFEEDDNGGRLTDKSGSGVKAQILGENYFGYTEEGNSYLDLTMDNAYLSLTKEDDSGVLSGLTEMTVEMRVLTKDENTNWALFAAPNNGAAPTHGNEQYLGVLLKKTDGNLIKVERFGGGRGENNSADNFIAEWAVNKWQTIKVVFGTESTTLYIDDEQKGAESSTFLLADCVGTDGVLWFGHASWGDGESFNGYMDEIKIWKSASDLNDENLLAHFDFEGDTDEERLQNKSGNEVKAELKDSITGVHGYVTEGSEECYLDLSNTNAYLSLTKEDGSGVLNGLTEMTVEMRVKTDNTNTNWAFFAAPNGDPPKDGDECYLGILLNDEDGKATVKRYANSGSEPDPKFQQVGEEWTVETWHTIKVVFKISSTILYVDDDVTEIGTPYSLKKCVGEDGVLWFGHASGVNKSFNGFIDYIKIWDHAIYEPIDEQKYIVAERVTNPKYTTVNMFDYWITDQGDNDYRALDGNNHSELLQGINDGHLLLFAGETAFEGEQADSSEIGFWNRSRGLDGYDTAGQNTITQGIVNRKLGADGYPQLAINDLLSTSGKLPSLLEGYNSEKYTQESLAYLFDPNIILENGKASYPNVTGLFQMNERGYYDFHSWNTFAELNVEQETGNNHITLYDTTWDWGLNDTDDNVGQFFPFNDWSNMFFEEQSENGKAAKQALINYDNSTRGGAGQTTTDEPLNHYFGMTVETGFQQPTDGMLNRGEQQEPMKFTFSGDDDVWIFIDDVLVGDLGGIHGWKSISIDFSEGKIYFPSGEIDSSTGEIVLTEEDKRNAISLAAMFENAIEGSTENWKTVSDGVSQIFPDNSIHTLKFFYLERGNQFSNCNITFNLQEPIVDSIRKVKENGDPLAGVKFELYEAEKSDIFNEDSEWHTSGEFKKNGTPMTITTSGEDGYALLVTEKGEALQYRGYQYYILEETETPEGYRKNPPVILQYHSGANTLTVVNKYEVGAYASFNADWTSGSKVFFAEYVEESGTFPIDENNIATDLENGLAIMVPIIKINGEWLPIYGSNTYGWNTVMLDSGDKDDLIKALSVAAIMQIANPQNQDWYLRWDESEQRLKGYIENLPGDATRYVGNNMVDPDLNLVALFLSTDALGVLGMDTETLYEDDDERYKALEAALTKIQTDEEAKEKVGDIEDISQNGFGILYTDDFLQNRCTVIYVPNEQRELRVRKVGENDTTTGLSGATFGIYGSASDAAEFKNALTTGTTDNNGELIFRANDLPDSEEKGYAFMDWDSDSKAVYWLREITAPTAPCNYKLNENLVRIEVNSTGIYANATGFDSKGNILQADAAKNDGIEVEASLGRLTQILVKYAQGEVDETLKDITFTKQIAGNKADGAVGSWEDTATGIVNQTYNKANGYGNLTFTVEDGYIRIMPRQTIITGTTSAVRRDILTDKDGKPVNLNGLFCQTNTVVVTDPLLSDNGNLTVSKIVEGDEGDKTKEFNFTVKLGNDSINDIYGDMTFENGEATFTLHHGESKTAKGLPAGTGYTVTETEANQDGYTTTATGSNGTIIANETATAIFVNIRELETSSNESSESNKPEEPSEPESNGSSAPETTPEEPSAPDLYWPNEPSAPDGSYGSSASGDLPMTGDEMHLGFWFAVMMLSLLVVTAMENPLRKRW